MFLFSHDMLAIVVLSGAIMLCIMRKKPSIRHSGLEPESHNLSRKPTSLKRFHQAVGLRVKPAMTVHFHARMMTENARNGRNGDKHENL